MINKIKQTIERYNLLNKGDTVVVALSGGPDSTALLEILARIAKTMNLNLIVAHFNHMLRGLESGKDEEFCRSFAGKKRLVFVSGKLEKIKSHKGISPEDFYRRQRYSFLNKVAQNHGAQKIALGHNLQDQAHTVLLNLLRGSGSEGLRGILPIRDDKYIRPLIEVSRKEIIGFLNKFKIAYRRDSSNKNKKYLRNKIREELIPYLKKEFNPKIEENLAKMTQILRQEDEFIQRQVFSAMASPYIKVEPDRISLDIQHISSLHGALRSRLFKTLLESFSTAKSNYSFIHVKALEQLLEGKQSGKSISLPLSVVARYEYTKLILERKKCVMEKTQYEYKLNIPDELWIAEKGLSISLQVVSRDYINLKSNKNIYMDLERIQQPLILRNRREGDWFEPMGTPGRQKIKKFFIDHKIPRAERNTAMLIVDGISVVWIENMHLSDRVKITAKSKNILCIEINKP